MLMLKSQQRITPTFLSLLMVRLSIRHLWGAKNSPGGNKRISVLCVVKNGEEYVDTFMKHHIDLGVEHFYFLDNGSTDRTIDRIKQHDHVTILRCVLPFKKYARVLKSYLRREYGIGGWTLLLDIDELFDYYDSSRLSLHKLLDYMEEHSCNRMLANMLELFADAPLDVLSRQSVPNLKEVYSYYDAAGYAVSHDAPHVHLPEGMSAYGQGGIRTTYFNYTDGALCKFPLAYYETRKECMEERVHTPSSCVRVADVSGILYHFQFTGSLQNRASVAVQSEHYGHKSRKYKVFLERLLANPGVNLKDVSIKPTKLTGTSQLLDCGLIYSTPQFREYVKRC